MSLIDPQTEPETRDFGTSCGRFVAAGESWFGRAGSIVNAAVRFVEHQETSRP